MNEPKDDLLAAFENPDMAVPEMPQEEAVSNTVPEAPVAPAQPTVTPVQPAPANPAPVGPQVAPVTPTPAPVAETPVTPVAEDNQNTMPNVSEEPAVAVAQNTPVDKKDEDGSLKKSLTFIILICIVIAAFIFFLPKIMSFFSGGSF